LRRQQAEIIYQAKEGEQTERTLDCYGVLYLQGQWYAIGYCHLRQAIRMFRLDRILRIALREDFFPRPHNFDTLTYAVQSIAAMPSRWLAEVLLDTTLEQVRWTVPPTFATLEEKENGTLLRAYDDDLDHLARFLVNLGCPFLVQQPPELLDALQQLGEQLVSMVAQAQRDQAHDMCARHEGTAKAINEPQRS
jgi:predicted DNA-binding transcriptional regulator YafY